MKVTAIVKLYTNVQIKEIGERNEFVRRYEILPGFRTLSIDFKAMENWLIEIARVKSERYKFVKLVY